MAKTLTYMQFARKYKAAMVQLRAKEIQNRELMKQLDTVTENLQTVRTHRVFASSRAAKAANRPTAHVFLHRHSKRLTSKSLHPISFLQILQVE